MDIRTQCLCIDTSDPARIASFWQSALGWRRTFEEEDQVVLEPPEGSAEDGIVPDLLFLKVPEGKVVKNRLHLDLRPGDQATEVARLEALGARRIDEWSDSGCSGDSSRLGRYTLYARICRLRNVLYQRITPPRGYRGSMLVTAFEILLGVVGLALVTLGVYGILRDKFGAPTSGGALGGTISLPLSGLLVILGLISLGFAVYLPASEGVKSQTATPVDTPGIVVSSPAPSISATRGPSEKTSVTGTATPTARPITLTCSINQKQLRPGMTVQLTYHVDSPITRQVGLGAGLYDEQANDYSNGDGDISSTTVRQGRSSPSRQVTIPANLPPGKYELDAEIWPPNEIGQNSVNDLVDTTCTYFSVP